jgi:hypothetical protein
MNLTTMAFGDGPEAAIQPVVFHSLTRNLRMTATGRSEIDCCRLGPHEGHRSQCRKEVNPRNAPPMLCGWAPIISPF